MSEKLNLLKIKEPDQILQERPSLEENKSYGERNVKGNSLQKYNSILSDRNAFNRTQLHTMSKIWNMIASCKMIGYIF